MSRPRVRAVSPERRTQDRPLPEVNPLQASPAFTVPLQRNVSRTAALVRDPGASGSEAGQMARRPGIGSLFNLLRDRPLHRCARQASLPATRCPLQEKRVSSSASRKRPLHAHACLQAPARRHPCPEWRRAQRRDTPRLLAAIPDGVGGGKPMKVSRTGPDAHDYVLKCPRGKLLRPRSAKGSGRLFSARTRDCARCPLRSACVTL